MKEMLMSKLERITNLQGKHLRLLEYLKKLLDKTMKVLERKMKMLVSYLKNIAFKMSSLE